MKKAFLCGVSFVIILLGCASDHDAYNVEGFKAVKAYVDTIIPIMDQVIENEDDSYKVEMKKANEALYDFGPDKSYTKEEMDEWTIELGLEEGEWLINGPELYEELENTYQVIHAYIESSSLSEQDLETMRASRESLGEMFRQ